MSRLGTLGKVKQKKKKKKNQPCHNVLLTACHQTHGREQQLPVCTSLGPPSLLGSCSAPAPGPPGAYRLLQSSCSSRC